MASDAHWGNLHVHSRYSKLDGMTTVKSLVEKAARLKQPFLGLSDHGTMAGAVQLYVECTARDITPFIGFEGYLLDPDQDLDTKNAGRYHFGVYALDFDGYQALVRVMSLSHTRPRFNRFPRLTLDDLLDLGQLHGKHLALTTGCFFGMVQQKLVRESRSAAEGVLRVYASAFPNMYVELQHHNRPEDDQIVSTLFDMAFKMGYPVICTNDNHYTDQSQQSAHNLMKRMVYGGEDDEFPGDSYHLPSTEWVKEHYADAPVLWQSNLEGCKDLLRKNHIELPALDDYKPRVPVMWEMSANRKLQRLCWSALGAYTDGFWSAKKKAYADRLENELAVIRKVGMADYFHILVKLVKWCRAENICIEVRGSANGSLVLYLLGVTTVDPIKWDTSFERFLSEDRINPPDVDLDVEDARRGDIVAKLQQWFPGALPIGTHTSLGIRDGDDQGSAVITWKSYRARIAKERGRQFKDGWVQSVHDVAKVAPRDAVQLRKIDKMKSVLRSYGVHAAGVLLPGSDMPIGMYVPSMLVASSNTTVTQFDQDDVEKLGYLKLDILGQTSLTVMRLCQEYIGRKNPSDFSWIPDDDPDACKLMCEGRTDTGIFHYEGYTKAKGAHGMKIRSTTDSVLAIALFMPGAMDIAPGMQISQTDLYLQRRRDKRLRDGVTYLHPVFEKSLKPTYGTVIYQDQVMQIMRGLGMSIPAVNKFIKVVKDSGKGSHERNAERMAAVREEFDKLCLNQGLDPDEVWRQTASFINYGFNKAHATGYGIRAYRTAYLKAHYPAEYMAALLHSWSGTKKEPLYQREARRMGIRLQPPDVNVSGPKWTLDMSHPRRPTIRKGLLSVKGVGVAAAASLRENAPYADLDDLIARCPARPVSGGKTYDGSNPETLTGVLGALYRSGALNSIV